MGILSFGADLPETATQEEVLRVVRDFNDNPDVHGILVQLPVRLQAHQVMRAIEIVDYQTVVMPDTTPSQLPKHIDEQAVLGAVSLEKDVDGFHPLNVGHLAMKVSSGMVAWATDFALLIVSLQLEFPVCCAMRLAGGVGGAG